MPSKPKIIGTPWGFSNLWNQALATFPERPLQKRNYIWASELGRPYIDRYLKMHGIPYSTPPNDRSRRKFVAGHLWEWVVGMVLTVTGVLKERQLRGEVELPGLLKVSGKLDYIAGGTIDWEKVKAEIKRIQDFFAVSIDEMPPFIFYAIQHIVDGLEKQFNGNPLKLMIVEAKSVSSFMSEKIQKTEKPMPHHNLQIGHYIIANETIDEGKLIYICKDDTIAHEFQVNNNKELKKIYVSDIKGMTEIYNASNFKKPIKTMPDKEPEILFTEGVWRFEKNFNVEYSNYLEFLYGYKTPELFRLRWQRKVAAWNRVFKRCVRKDNMTADNKIIIKEASQTFPDWDKYVLKARANGAFLKPEEEEE